MSSLLIWGLALLGLAVLLMVVEIFVPTAGVISALALISTLAGLVFLFQFDTTWGLGGLLGVIVLWPMIFIGGLQIWRNTAIGRKVIGVPTDEEQERARHAAELERQRWAALLGAEGVVVTDCRPLGVIEIAGRRYDAMADTSFIKAGTRVRVTVAEANQLRVRAMG